MVTPAERLRIEAMWVVYLMLTLAALYAVIITGMYFAQTRLLFPTMFAGSARVQLPDQLSVSRSGRPTAKALLGCEFPLRERRPTARRRCLALAGTPGTQTRRPSHCTRSFLIAM